MWRKNNKLKAKIKELFKNIKPIYCVFNLIGSAILAFGLYQVHSLSGVTEGGALGLTLLLQYWFDISPAVTGFIINILCYILGWRTLGKEFLVYSAFAAGGFSVFFKIFEQFPQFWPQLYDMPLVAAIAGALFVGIGVGICVLAGGAPTGDDALAMSLSHKVNIDIQWVYLISDLSVLVLSLSYIPFSRLIYSLVTVILSGQIIGLMQKVPERIKAKV